MESGLFKLGYAGVRYLRVPESKLFERLEPCVGHLGVVEVEVFKRMVFS